MNRSDVSGMLQGIADADYLVADGVISPSREGQLLLDLRQSLAPHWDRLGIAWCGAAMARIFRQHRWLQSFQVELWAEAVYNDEGGRFMAHYVQFHAAHAVPHASLPEEVQDHEGSLDANAAAELLKSEHEDDEFDLCVPFIGQDSADSCTLTLHREVLAPLLAGAAASGLAVARLLWPDHESLRSCDARSPTPQSAESSTELPA